MVNGWVLVGKRTDERLPFDSGRRNDVPARVVAVQGFGLRGKLLGHPDRRL